MSIPFHFLHHLLLVLCLVLFMNFGSIVYSKDDRLLLGLEKWEFDEYVVMWEWWKKQCGTQRSSCQLHVCWQTKYLPLMFFSFPSVHAHAQVCVGAIGGRKETLVIR